MPGKRAAQNAVPQKEVGWRVTLNEANWDAGSLDQLGDSKRACKPWKEKSRSLSAIYEELRPRVDACWKHSVGGQVCQALADQLHSTMASAPLEDLRRSVAGEKSRILTRALAMREVLRIQDPTVGATQVRVEPQALHHQQQNHKASSKCAVMPLPTGQQQQGGGRVVTMQRSSNEAEPDALPDQCVLAVCMLMAALFEQTPWGEGGDLRRRVYHDFTQLKRHFRQDELQIMYGKTGTTQELFEAVKALDRTKGLQNLIGIIFEDWKVNQRVDPFILADGLEVEVLTLTSDGPIGKFKCKMRTLVTLSLLHQRLLKDMYHNTFADKQPPNKHLDMMTSADALDFIDFTEALGRNIPHKHVEGSELYYAWMYAPEVHAAPEVWQQVFGPGNNKLPTLFDGVTTPDNATAVTKDGDYALDLLKAAANDYLSQGSAQAAVGFPWADDLIGAYLRKLQQELPAKKALQLQLQKQQQAQQALATAASMTGRFSASGAAAGPAAPVAIKQEAGGSMTPIKQEEGVSLKREGSATQSAAWPLPAQATTPQPSQPVSPVQPQGNGVKAEDAADACQRKRARLQRLQMSAQQAWTLKARANFQNGGQAAGMGRRMSGPGQGVRINRKTSNGGNGSIPPSSPSSKATARASASGTTTPKDSKPAVPPIPNADETGQLVLPLGIFLVGVIVSGAFTNTQVHVEDLLLMSININMFGSPKVWWWVPQEKVQAFKEAAELMTEGGRRELYTKSISPFLTDRETPGHPEQVLPLERLRELGVKRTIQLPGMGIWTMPGYAFHFTVSMGLNVAESCNMFLELMGWTFEKLWLDRPIEQYPEPEDDMGRYMRETGLLKRLGVPDRLPRDAGEIHKELGRRPQPGIIKCNDGQHLQRQVYSELIKYATLPSPSSTGTTSTAVDVQGSGLQQQQEVVSQKRTPSPVSESQMTPPSGSDEGEATDGGQTQQVVLPPELIKELASIAAGLPAVAVAPQRTATM